MDIRFIWVFFITIMVIIISGFLYVKAAGNLSLTKFNMISLSYYFFIVFSVIGTMLIASNKDKHHMARYIRHGNIRLDTWGIVMMLMIVFPLIIIFLNRILKVRARKYVNYLEKDTEYDASDNSIYIVTVLAALVCIGAIIYTFIKMGINNIPILGILRKVGTEELAKMRNFAGEGFKGNQYIKNILAVGTTPFISYIAYLYMRKTKKVKWICLFLILFVFSTIINIYDLQKAPILIYWSSFFILGIYYGDKIKARYYWAFGILCLFSIVIMYVVIQGSSLKKIFSIYGPINRIILTSAMAFALHMEVFSYRRLLLNGASMPKPILKLLGIEESLKSGRAVMLTINKEGIKREVAGVYNGLFLGEAYANFGYLGMFISMIHIPVLFFITQYILTKIKKTPVTVSLYTYFTVQFLFGLHGGYASYVFNAMWLFIIIISVGMIYTGKIMDKILLKKELS